MSIKPGIIGIWDLLYKDKTRKPHYIMSLQSGNPDILLGKVYYLQL